MRNSPEMGLSRRLALLTAVISVALVLGATEVALRWSERSRLADRRRESVELATSWSEYLSRTAPNGERDAITQALVGWPSQHLSLSNAALFAREGDALSLVASSDTGALAAPSRNDSSAMRCAGPRSGTSAAIPRPGMSARRWDHGTRPMGCFT